MKQELLKGGSDALKLGLLDHGRPVAPSSCAIRILDGGSLLEGGDAPAGVYVPGASTVGAAKENLVAEWTFQVGGGAVERRVELFDVVLFRLYPIASDQDLIREAAILGSSEYVRRGKVASSSAQSIVDRTLIGAREDWAGAVLTFSSGADAGSQYIVSGFAPSTGTIDYPAGTPASAGDEYVLRRSYQGELDAAWDDLYDKLVQTCAGAPDGSRAHLVMTPDRLKRPHLLRALEKIFRGMATDPAGVDWARAEHYAKEFEAAWSGIQLVFAERESATPAPSHEGSLQFGFGR